MIIERQRVQTGGAFVSVAMKQATSSGICSWQQKQEEHRQKFVKKFVRFWQRVEATSRFTLLSLSRYRKRRINQKIITYQVSTM